MHEKSHTKKIRMEHDLVCDIISFNVVFVWTHSLSLVCFHLNEEREKNHSNTILLPRRKKQE